MKIDGTAEADAIILRRLTKCIRDPVQDPTSLLTGHMHYTDPRRTCPRCGINRLFQIEHVYEDTYDLRTKELYRLPVGIVVTLV